MRCECGDGEADVADEGVRSAEFDGAKAEAMLLEVGFDAVCKGVAFGLSEWGGHELRDAKIRVDADEGGAVGVAPVTEDKARCG